MLQRRSLHATEFRFEQNANGEHEIAGYAAVYGVLSHVLWRDWETGKPVRERLLHGAFDGADLSDVTLNVNHDDRDLLARTLSGTLVVTPDTTGLAYRGKVPDTQLGRDVGVQMTRRDLRENSFAFTVSRDDIEVEEAGDELIENIKRIQRVFDVSIVTRAAYPQASSTFRSDAMELRSLSSGPVTREQLQVLIDRISPAITPEPGTGNGERQRQLALARLAQTTRDMEMLCVNSYSSAGRI